jgi:hypothetical protein
MFLIPSCNAKAVSSSGIGYRISLNRRRYGMGNTGSESGILQQEIDTV